MKRMLWFLTFLAVLLTPRVVFAEGTICAEGSVCVEQKDLKIMLDAVRQQKCFMTTKPEFKLDPVTVVVDKDHRVFFSGASPHPYTLDMAWCGYQAKGEGEVKVVAGIKEEPAWGIRLRPKAYLAVLVLEPWRTDLDHSWDAGLALDWLYWRDLNLNIGAGFRSVNVSLGYDLTRNLSLLGGYAFGWNGGTHNPFVGVSLAIW